MNMLDVIELIESEPIFWERVEKDEYICINIPNVFQLPKIKRELLESEGIEGADNWSIGSMSLSLYYEHLDL